MDKFKTLHQKLDEVSEKIKTGFECLNLKLDKCVSNLGSLEKRNSNFLHEFNSKIDTIISEIKTINLKK